VSAGHGYVLRSPWYARERQHVSVFDQQAERPLVQKYASDDFVDRLLADPRDSVAFGQEDLWTFPVPVALGERGRGRRRFATHRLVRTPMRKLYQPSHERFYALAVELFCDEPGLPRPGDVEGVEVGFVVRRERVQIRGSLADVRALARDLAVQLDTEQNARTTAADPIPDDGDLEDVAWVEQAAGHAFTTHQAQLLAAIRPLRVVEGWVAGPAGHGVWRVVDDGAPPDLLPGEQEQRMWPLPPQAAGCDAARTRSLWFGVLPTISAEVDDAGLPKLDDRSIYRVRCFARRRPGPGREDCPPELWWSEPTEPYRLAAFMDPAGTSNHSVTITAPDFRALAARAGEPPGPGGVRVVRPPGSQLRFDPLGGIPSGGSLGGTVASSCTFALELLMIVAMFLFSLFMPVVVFAFQLWWMLALRFCFPRPDQALQLLADFFENTGDLAALPANLRDDLDELLDTPGAAAKLAGIAPFDHDRDVATDVLATVDPLGAAPAVPPSPEPVPEDPLCPAPAPVVLRRSGPPAP
jgi:hypothetical protein